MWYINIHQFQISIQLPQLPTWTHPFLWDVLRCGHPPSARARHSKFTSSILYVWLCMEKFYEQLVTCLIKMIKIKEISGHSCQSLSYCAAHVSPKLASVLCLPRFCDPNIDQLCTQKLAYYIHSNWLGLCSYIIRWLDYISYIYILHYMWLHTKHLGTAFILNAMPAAENFF